jgi:hypothetical protein
MAAVGTESVARRDSGDVFLEARSHPEEGMYA